MDNSNWMKIEYIINFKYFYKNVWLYAAEKSLRGTDNWA